MKKIALILLLALVLSIPAMAEAAPERTVYADQGGVCVFVENGLAGLMDAGGNVLLPAEYDTIEPFLGADWAIVHRGEKRGVVGRDGHIAIPCEWEWIELYPGVRLASCRNDWDTQQIVDLDTGAVWMTAGDHLAFDADDDCAYVLTFGEAGFGYEPPYHTDVYDCDRKLLFGADAWFVRGFDSDYAILAFDDDTYGAMNRDGKILVSGLSSMPWTDGGDNAYGSTRTGALHTVRTVKNPLNDWLRPLKLDRHHMEYYLGLLGIDLDRRWAEALLSFYDDGCACGIVEPDGTPRFEITGAAIYGPDEAGLYRYQASGYDGIILPTDMWGYVDRDGNPVLEAVYNEAYPFVDGAAVVRQGKRWHLIDVEGNQVGDITWTWRPNDWRLDTLALPVIPIENPDGEGYRVIDRRGAYVTDEVFQTAGDAFNGRLLVLVEMDEHQNDLEQRLCIMDGSGKVTLRLPNDLYLWAEDDDAIAVRQDGGVGLMAVDGARAGEWLIPPQYDGIHRQESGAYYLWRSDGSAVLADGEGNVFGPGPAYEPAYDF